MFIKKSKKESKIYFYISRSDLNLEFHCFSIWFNWANGTVSKLNLKPKKWYNGDRSLVNEEQVVKTFAILENIILENKQNEVESYSFLIDLDQISDPESIEDLISVKSLLYLDKA
jgi:hypothetical protein